MQFVWIYLHDQANGDELRWSIRSVLQNYLGNAKILVVGDRPPWYQGPHLAVDQVNAGTDRSYRDTLNKLRTACKSDLVESQFVWMMDDIYWVRSFGDADLQQPRHRSEFIPATTEAWQPVNRWQRLKKDTIQTLHDQGYHQVRDSATHLPQWVEKQKVLQLWAHFGLSNQRVLIWEILYHNTFLSKSIQCDDYQFRTLRPHSQRTLNRRIRQSHVFNHGDKAWNSDLQAWLRSYFRVQCEFENDRNPSEDYILGHIPKQRASIAIVPYRERPGTAQSCRWIVEYLQHRFDRVILCDTPSETFSRSQAINNGVRCLGQSYTNDTILAIFDSDGCLTDQSIATATELARTTGRLVIPFDRVSYLGPAESETILTTACPVAGVDLNWSSQWKHTPGHVGFINFIRLDAFHQVNGFDEGYVGWGYEDNAFSDQCDRVLGCYRRVESRAFHFYHLVDITRGVHQKNRQRYLLQRKG